MQRTNINGIDKKSNTIDFKIDEYCVYLPTRECVNTYVRLVFFDRMLKEQIFVVLCVQLIWSGLWNLQRTYCWFVDQWLWFSIAPWILRMTSHPIHMCHQHQNNYKNKLFENELNLMLHFSLAWIELSMHATYPPHLPYRYSMHATIFLCNM